MDGLGVCCHAGLFECFGESRVGVAGSSQVFRAGAVLEPNHSFCDHLTSARADNMGAQESVGLLVGQNLDHAVGVGDGLGPGVGQEGEHSLGVLNP